MQEPNEGGENQSPQDRTEVSTGAARLGATLLNTSTDQPTQCPRQRTEHQILSRRVPHATVQAPVLRYYHALHTLSWVLGPPLPTTWVAWTDPSVPRGRSWPPTAARTTSVAARCPAGQASRQTHARDPLAAAVAVAVGRWQWRRRGWWGGWWRWWRWW